MTLREGALVRILFTASGEPEQVAAVGQLATLLAVEDMIPPEVLWEAALFESGEIVYVYEDEVEVVQP